MSTVKEMIDFRPLLNWCREAAAKDSQGQIIAQGQFDSLLNAGFHQQHLVKLCKLGFLIREATRRRAVYTLHPNPPSEDVLASVVV